MYEVGAWPEYGAGLAWRGAGLAWRGAGLARPDREQSAMPAVYWFDPSCEEQVARGCAGFVPGRLPRLLAEDLELLPVYLAGPRDVLLVRRTPRPAFLQRLADAGFSLPRCVEVPGSRLDRRTCERIVAGTGMSVAGPVAGAEPLHLRPWGWSPETAAFLAPLASMSQVKGVTAWSERLARLYSKAFGAEVLEHFLRDHSAPWLCPADAVGEVCSTTTQVTAVLQDCLRPDGAARAVIKAQFGQAGRQQLRVATPRLEERQQAWLNRVLQNQERVVVEPWLDRVMDLSMHLDIGATGRATYRGWVRFLSDDHGQFRGAVISAGEDGSMPAAAASAASATSAAPAGLPSRGFADLLGALADHVGASFTGSGYEGPVGVDMLIYRDADRHRLKPVVEINPRFTMGRVALHLAKALAPGCAGIWSILSVRQVLTAGFDNITGLLEELRRCQPYQRGERGLEQGVLSTTDPETAQAFLSLLVVGPGIGACVEMLDAYPPLGACVPSEARQAPAG